MPDFDPTDILTDVAENLVAMGVCPHCVMTKLAEISGYMIAEFYAPEHHNELGNEFTQAFKQSYDLTRQAQTASIN